MNFGHRVKSMTLGDFKTEELDQMRDAGNLVSGPGPTAAPRKQQRLRVYIALHASDGYIPAPIGHMCHLFTQ
jgi:hypothetical protein